MTRPTLVVAAVLALAAAAPAAAQQPAADAPRPTRSSPVLTQALQDSAFAGAVLSSSVLELLPGAVLPQDHRHDAELFGYVLSGAVLTSLDDGPVQRYEEGQMFYERRGVLHTHFENPNADRPARVLILQLAKPAAGAR